MATRTRSQPAVAPSAAADVVTMQGTQVNASSVDAASFFANTRRQNLLMKTLATSAGFGFIDTIPILQTGIISQLQLRIYGNLTVAASTGSVAATWQWPYNYVQAARFSANGQSNLINTSGLALKAFAMADRNQLNDRGVTKQMGAAQVNQGTLSLSSENWGVGPGQTAIASGTYDVELIYNVPIAYDNQTLLGAIFAQTQSTDLNLALQYSPIASMFNIVAPATVTFTPTVVLEATVYTIPSVGGQMVIPDLSVFHNLIESKAANGLSTGNNEVTLSGQGVGRKLMRLLFQCWNNGVPMTMSAANFANLYWRYGGNTTPEQFIDGTMLRQWDENVYSSDYGAQWGYGCFDWSSEFAKRDSIDEGKVTQLRYGFTIPSTVTLTAPYLQQIQQTLVAGAVGVS